jgi:Holliday junction resolvase RusA-like endonuclease
MREPETDFVPGECAVVDALLFEASGIPAPQGSKSGFVIKKGALKGKVVMVESSKKVRPWRKVVALACIAAVKEAGDWERHVDGPIKVVVQFWVKAPKAPKWKVSGRPDRTPDLDKLARSTMDGISDSKVIWGDDNQVVDLHVIEHYGRSPGARIHVVALREIAKPQK